MASDDLLPCPFCGGEAERQDFETVGTELGNDPNAGGSCICCKTCGASSPVHFDRKENLISSWNERAALAASAAVDGDAQWNAALRDVAAERRRQVEREGWTPEHDDEHTCGELAKAASVYALHSAQPPKIVFCAELQETIPDNWPWAGVYWKPYGPRRDLVRAGALIIAEIERLDRALKRLT